MAKKDEYDYKVSDDEKLDRFMIAVNESIDRQVNNEIRQAMDESSRIINQAKSDALRETGIKLDDEIRKLTAYYKKLKATALQESKMELLSYREMLIERIMKNVQSKIIEFTSANEYLDYLCSLIDSSTITQSTVIRLRADDFERYRNEIIKRLNIYCDFEIDESIKYGGINIYDKDCLVIDDKTLDSALEDEREKICTLKLFQIEVNH